MRLDDQEESSNYEVQRGGSGGFGGLGGGGGGMIGMLLPMIGSKFGCTGIVIALAIMAFLNFGGGGLILPVAEHDVGATSEKFTVGSDA